MMTIMLARGTFLIGRLSGYCLPREEIVIGVPSPTPDHLGETRPTIAVINLGK